MVEQVGESGGVPLQSLMWDDAWMGMAKRDLRDPRPRGGEGQKAVGGSTNILWVYKFAHLFEWSFKVVP